MIEITTNLSLGKRKIFEKYFRIHRVFFSSSKVPSKPSFVVTYRGTTFFNVSFDPTRMPIPGSLYHVQYKEDEKGSKRKMRLFLMIFFRKFVKMVKPFINERMLCQMIERLSSVHWYRVKHIRQYWLQAMVYFRKRKVILSMSQHLAKVNSKQKMFFKKKNEFAFRSWPKNNEFCLVYRSYYFSNHTLHCILRCLRTNDKERRHIYR